MDVEAFKRSLRSRGLVLDIDETLSATNVAWFERLVLLFGNPPEGLSIPDLIAKYQLAQNVPHWQTDEAYSWMQTQRDSPDAQKGLPLIPGAVEGVKRLLGVAPVVGYLTVRPVGVVEPTIEWLRLNGFPDLPGVAQPEAVPFAEGNQWKGRVLNELYPMVTGIVDDNPKVAFHAGTEYPGALFLFGHAEAPEIAAHAVPCATWDDVVVAATARQKVLV